MTLKKLVAAAFSVVLTAGVAFAGDIQIEDAYARAASPVAKTGAAFMHISNNSDIDDTLIAVITDAARKPELHTHIIEDGIAKMREVEGGMVIPAGGTTVLKRGGLHIMLMGLTKPLLHGETVTLTLVFENSGEMTIEVPVDNERHDAMEMDHSGMNMDGNSMSNMSGSSDSSNN